jgi:Rieske Fe-S protein
MSEPTNRQPPSGQDHTIPETPVWQEDFPISSAGEDAVGRRAFTRYLIGGSAAFAATSVGAAAWTSLRDLPVGSERALISLDELPTGASHLFRFPGPDDPAVLVHLADGSLEAYSQKCTHLGCVVFWEAENQELVCPCHEGVFDARDGRPIAGPPERPLPKIELEIRDDTVWAMRIER